ncbi:MAG TPA: cyclic nucleotide-binding domain-containing protein [Vicinamibacteria bacterium]|nr:cyclic nucleotide-binding domain-containing protein [Vicinamibacteria bacterium]
MVLSFGQGKDEDVSTLIARKNYTRAIEVIKNQLKTQRPDPRLRLQLGDVLVMAGKTREAVAILTPLADEFAREGFAAKAISVLKKIQKIDPGARDVNTKLAALIQEKQQHATVPMPAPPSGGLEIGMEEIGFDFGGGSVTVPAADTRRAAPPEIGIEQAAPEPEPPPPPPPPPPPARAPAAAPAPAKPAAPAPAAKVAPAKPAPPPQPVAPPPAPVVDRDLFAGELMVEPEPEPELALAPEPVLDIPQDTANEPGLDFSLTDTAAPAVPAAEVPFSFEPEAEPIPEAVPLPDPAPAEVDLFAEAVQAIEVVPEPVATVVPEPESPPALQEDEMSESLFADELLSLVEGAFKDVPAEGPTAAAAAEGNAPSEGGNQIVVSPLFKDFSVDELVAVIQGLNLLTYQPGEIIIMEGDPGQSLYMLTSGTVRALKRNAQGRQATVGELTEGAFFGEVSILSGGPRTATVVAATYCELLELDRGTLDGIVKTHPRVLDILKEFAAVRQKRS